MKENKRKNFEILPHKSESSARQGDHIILYLRLIVVSVICEVSELIIPFEIERTCRCLSLLAIHVSQNSFTYVCNSRK